MKPDFIYPFAFAILLFSSCANDSSEKTAEENAATSRVDSILGSTSSGGFPAASGSGDVKLNPPHGEPGHRCEIAVGAPLTAAPIDQPEINIVENPTPPLQQTVTPQPTESASEMLAKGLNPPHGAPGHDCAIPVGQPLKK